jgi:hypothetical protein
MPVEKCQECGAEINDFDECTHGNNGIRSAASKISRPFRGNGSTGSFDDFGDESPKSNLVWPYIIAPLGAIVFDYVAPWSIWYVTLFLVLATFMIINTVLNVINSGTKIGFKTFLMSLARSINAPGTIALRSNSGKKARNIMLWSFSVIAAVIVVFSNVTTANANSLESRLTAEGLELTGKEFEVSCPTGFTSGLPGSEITCRAKIILGITVPVTVEINGPFEELTWKAGW